MINIRQANRDDLPGLVLLFESYRNFYGMPADSSAAASFLMERMNNGESVIFVTEENGSLSGFAQLYPLFSSTRLKRLWLLNDLFVKKEERGKGISVRLIDSCKELCRNTGAAGLLLETAKSNLIGNRLYRKTGFTCDDAHHYYSWNTDHPAL